MTEIKLEQVKQFLIEYLSPTLLVVFGSVAKRVDRENSDLDIAFLSDQSFDAYQVFMAAQGLAAVLNRDVDLVDLSKASTVFQMQIISSGNVFYEKDQRLRQEFEMKVYKMYAKLNEERQPVFKKIKESGSVYGK